MPLDLTKFDGTLPYASELLGVFQPLLGWKGNQPRRRVDAEGERLTRGMVEGVLEDSRAWSYLAKNPREPVRPDVVARGARPPGWVTGAVGAALHDVVSSFVDKNGRLPASEEWRPLVDTEVASALRVLEDATPAEGVRVGDLGVVVLSRKTVPADRLAALRAQPIEGTDLALAPLRGELALASKAADEATDGLAKAARQAVMAGTLQYLSDYRPTLLGSFFAGAAERLRRAVAWVDPLANFDPIDHQAVLSPIGLLQIYRQYFFEFDTFLGPPVGHVWISPGGTVELFEIHTRRTLEERTVEIGTETVSRSETEVVEQDELSTAVAEQNARNTNVGISVSSGVNFGVVQASASVSTALQNTHSTSEQTAHKHARTQSERLSNEIRRNFKVSFRTSVEAEDVSSRRHVVQNTTDRLVNYELRRKMRQVGVQLQHVGTQLCWQIYIDNPGRELGIAELVHVAQPDDKDSALQPPDAPVKLAPKQTDMTVNFAFEVAPNSEGEWPDATYVRGVADVYGGFFTARIVHRRRYTAPSPGHGYRLAAVNEVSSSDPVDPERDPPEVAARYRVIGNDQFEIILDQANFWNQPAIRFTLDLIWDPPDQSAAEEEYERKYAEYTVAEQRAAHSRYVQAVRDRVKLAGQVRKRRGEGLREEERTVVFRRLVRRLMSVGEAEAPHVTSELMRAIFDVDAMLYFVAPEWWRPHRRQSQQVLAAPKFVEGTEYVDTEVTTLTSADKVTWGGGRAAGRPNYLVTEDSEPAPTGASLGWLLQLDADEHRNAFLNTPWVKAVIPIRPGRERTALTWLERAEVEGSDGLDEEYAGLDMPPGTSIREALTTLADQIAAFNTDDQTVLATERVYQNGFDPLAGGFRATGTPFELFDQWIEVLPTDQVVAVEYDTGQGPTPPIVVPDDDDDHDH